MTTAVYVAVSAGLVGAIVGLLLGLHFGARRAAAIGERHAMVAFARGIQAGADGMADAYLRAAADAGDPIEAWPAPVGQVRRPS